MTAGLRPPAYRLPDATRLGAAHLQVSDLERSLDYYESIWRHRMTQLDDVLGEKGR